MKTIEMAREADKPDETCWLAYEIDFLERFAELIRADEREACSALDFRKEIGLTSDQNYKVSQLILFRGNK